MFLLTGWWTWFILPYYSLTLIYRNKSLRFSLSNNEKSHNLCRLETNVWPNTDISKGWIFYHVKQTFCYFIISISVDCIWMNTINGHLVYIWYRIIYNIENTYEILETEYLWSHYLYYRLISSFKDTEIAYDRSF